jgi:hypothetical protein
MAPGLNVRVISDQDASTGSDLDNRAPVDVNPVAKLYLAPIIVTVYRYAIINEAALAHLEATFDLGLRGHIRPVGDVR